MTDENPTPTTSAALALSDIVPLRNFAKECEQAGVCTKHQINWWNRYRHENGLLECGALVERQATPGSKRPCIFVVRPRFLAWLTSPSATRAPRIGTPEHDKQTAAAMRRARAA
jgi:hypothetical protein